ncbi:MAG: phosphate/phosphite/phosphonate ABC transporter substrate-binding protein [Eubacteriaceae bacterium]
MRFGKILGRLGVLSIGLAIAVFLTGCTSSQGSKKFVVAYLPNESTEQNADARNGMAKDLSEALGMEVEEFIASDYNAAIEGMRTGKVDMAYFGPLSFCLANERANAEPVVMKAKGGDKANATYKSVLIVKGDSPINSIKDIKGKTMAFVDPNSTSGNMIPSAEIMKAFPEDKLTMDSLHTNGEFFESVMFSGKHQAGLQAVIKGDVEVAPISDAILAAEIKNGNAKEGDVKIIYSSDPIPSEPMAVRGDISQDVKDKVKAFMTGYANEEYFEKVVGDATARWIPTTVEDYKSVMELNKELNK